MTVHDREFLVIFSLAEVVLVSHRMKGRQFGQGHFGGREPEIQGLCTEKNPKCFPRIRFAFPSKIFVRMWGGGGAP